VEMLDEEREFTPADYKKILLLDDVKDAGNLGTIIRTADWFGIDAIVCSETAVELYNPKTLQASMGSFTRVPVFYFNLEEFIQKHQNIYSFFCSETKGKSIQNLSFPEYSAIVLGSESFGISSQILDVVEDKICIPLGKKKRKHRPESLNVSQAAAVVCYEMMK